ncbi:hypothetical protein SAMN02745126_05696 [Enhydrobacter aerosaccus]|uniref:OpgC protein n=1 Tax=Enhydrobacter aerosaccus TaxID=225324 RepID=A0A1T4T5A5_9HYPH|nr:OpgC domain-containing protein [Enhydrobacter aerosaccus]SKA35626.1 hypothetical protein SAMN02745126_05696 [Enhydrobacter aerosaccus]
MRLFHPHAEPPSPGGSLVAGRLAILDGLRGYFLVFMFLNHLTFTGGYLLVLLNHAELAFVEGAQGFVFLSGLLAGLVHGRRMARHGLGTATVAIWNRAAEIYAYALGCVLIILVLQTLLPGSWVYWHHWLGDLHFGRGRHVAASALLLYQPDYLDVLPQYVVYLLATPPLIWLCLQGRWAWVAGGSIVLWLAVQLGAHLALADAVARLLPLRAYFNAFAWQLVFVAGLVLGTAMIQDRIDWSRLFRADRPQLALVAAMTVLFFAIWRVWSNHFAMPEAVEARLRALANRGEFGPVYLLNFVALAYLVTWVVRLGPATASIPLRWLAYLLDRLFKLSFLRLLGRHSLQVYAWHVIAVYLLKAVDENWGPFGEIGKTAIAVAGIMLLAVPAWMLERTKAVPRAGKLQPAFASRPIDPRP